MATTTIQTTTNTPPSTPASHSELFFSAEQQQRGVEEEEEERRLEDDDDDDESFNFLGVDPPSLSSFLSLKNNDGGDGDGVNNKRAFFPRFASQARGTGWLVIDILHPR